MLRAIALISLLISPLPAFALCEGTNLIKQLPLEEQQELRAHADQAPYPAGLLWRASKGATEITWFGTYHFRHEMTLTHLEALKPLIDTAQSVYLEISSDDTNKMERDVAADPSIMFITEAPTLPEPAGCAGLGNL